MNQSAVLIKTARGLDELRTRSRGLAQRVRNVLILIDGKATVGELLGRLAPNPGADLIIETLVVKGFAAPKSMAEPIAIEPPPPEVGQALNDLARYLHNELGPDADFVSLRIERAETRVEFAHAVRRGISMLSNIVSQNKANQFQTRAQAILDTYFSRQL